MTWLEGVSNLMKFLIFILNLLFVIVGIILISVGAVVKTEFSQYEWFLDDGFFSVPALLIAIGVIIFVVAFFGCCGFARGNYWMLLTFAVLLVLIFVLELSAGIAGYVLRDNTEQFIVNKMYTSMLSYDKTDAGSSHVWDVMQYEFECCGVKNASDWTNAYPVKNGTLPASCCHLINGQWGGVPCTTESNNLNAGGCLGSLKYFIISHASTLGGIGIGIGIIQFLGMIFAFSIARSIRNKKMSV